MTDRLMETARLLGAAAGLLGATSAAVAADTHEVVVVASHTGVTPAGWTGRVDGVDVPAPVRNVLTSAHSVPMPRPVSHGSARPAI